MKTQITSLLFLISSLLIKGAIGSGFLLLNYSIDQDELNRGSSFDKIVAKDFGSLFHTGSKVVTPNNQYTWKLDEIFDQLRMRLLQEKAIKMGGKFSDRFMDLMHNFMNKEEFKTELEYVKLFKERASYFVVNYLFAAVGFCMLIAGVRTPTLSVYVSTTYVAFYYIYYYAVTKSQTDPFDNKLHAFGLAAAAFLMLIPLMITMCFKAFGGFLLAFCCADIVCWYALETVFSPTPPNVQIKLLALTVECALAILILMCLKMNIGYIVATSIIGAIMTVLNSCFALNIFVSFEIRTAFDYNPSDDYKMFLLITAGLAMLGILGQILLSTLGKDDKQSERNAEFDKEMVISQ